MVLLDSPPLLPVTDAVGVNKLAGGRAGSLRRIASTGQSCNSPWSRWRRRSTPVRDCDEQDRSREAAAYGYGSGYASYTPKQRSAPVPAKRRWDLDDTFVTGQPPRNGHKAGAVDADRPTPSARSRLGCSYHRCRHRPLSVPSWRKRRLEFAHDGLDERHRLPGPWRVVSGARLAEPAAR